MAESREPGPRQYINMEGKKRSGYARLGLGRETNIGIGVAVGAVLLATLRRLAS